MKRGILSALAALGLIAGGAYLAFHLASEPPASPTAPVRSISVRQAPPPATAVATARLVPRAAVEAAAGEPFVVELMDPPETMYASPRETASDRAYAALVARLGRGNVTYDPILGRAARELALQQSLLDGIVPTEIVEFILRASGAVDRSVDQGYVATSSKADEVLVQQLVKLLAQTDPREPLRIGIGEAWLLGANPDRVAGVLISRRALQVDPAPRRVEPGATWTLSGTLPPGFGAPSALVLRQDGTLEEAPVRLEGERFRVEVAAGSVLGTLQVSLSGVGRFGPTPLVQLPVEVGGALASSYETRLPAREGGIDSVAAAERLARELLNRDRVRFGLPELQADPALDVIARGHSEDMRDGGFFGHVSPRTGSPEKRLAAAHYRFTGYAENVAMHGSLHEAEAGLLASLGHRRNILNGRMSHVGIGVAMSDVHGRRSYFLTQLFAVPAQQVNEAAVVAEMRARMSARRAVLGLAAFAGDGRLDRIARAQAAAAARGEAMDGVSKAVLASAEAEGLTKGGARVWALRTGDVADLTPGAALIEGAYARVGVGVVQDAQGAIFAVVIAAAP